MPPIDNGTITVKAAAIAMVTLLSLVTTGLTAYYSAKNGVDKGFEALRIELADKQNQINILKIELKNTSDQVDVNTITIKAIADFIKPGAPEIKRKNYR